MDLRRGKWVTKNVVDSHPKTMDQIIKEAEQQPRNIELIEDGLGKRGGDSWRQGSNSFMDNQWKSPRTQKNVRYIKLASACKHGTRAKNPIQSSSNSRISLAKNMYTKLDTIPGDPTCSYNDSSSRSGSIGVPWSNSGNRNSNVAAKQGPEAACSTPVAQEPLTEEKQKNAKMLVMEMLVNPNDEEFLSEFKQSIPVQYHSAAVTEMLNIALEKAAKDIHVIAKAMHHLISTGAMSGENFLTGMSEIVECAPDLYIDIPMLYEYLGKFFAPQIEKKHITFVQTFRLCENVIMYNQGHLFLKSVIRDLKESMGPSFVKIKWQESGLELKQWMSEEQIPKWIEDNKFEFLEGGSPSEDTKKILTPNETQSKLLQLMNSDENSDCIRGWVQDLSNMKLVPPSAWNHGAGAKNPIQSSSLSKNMYSLLDTIPGDPTSSYNDSSSRSGSIGVPRSNSGNRNSNVAAKQGPEAASSTPVAQEPLTEEKQKNAKMLVMEMLINPNVEEFLSEFKQSIPVQYHSAAVTEMLNIALEKAAKDVHVIAKAMHHLISTGAMSGENFLTGMSEIVECAPDLYIDIPMLYEYLGKFFAPQIEKKHITFVQTFRLCENVIMSNQGHLFLKSVIRDLKESMGPSFVKIKWQESGLELKQWMSEEQIPKWIEDNKFEFLEGGSPSEDTKKILTPNEIQSKLLQLMNSDDNCGCIRGWVQDNLGASSKENWFIRALIQAICEHALLGAEGRDVPHFSQQRMNKFAPLIGEFGESREQREASCLFGIQQLIHKLQHPPGLTLKIFQFLHEQCIISVKGFLAWEVSKMEPEGKGVMLQALTSFFANIKEADNEESCSED